MAKARTNDGELMEKASDPEASRRVKRPATKLPVLKAGEEDRALAEPIVVCVGPKRTWGKVVGLERRELAPGKKDGVKAPGQTVYLVKPIDGPDVTGSFTADQLELPPGAPKVG